MPADIPVAGNVLKVTSVAADTNDPTLEWGTDDSGAGTGANTFTAAQAVTPSVQTSAGALDMDTSNFIEVAVLITQAMLQRDLLSGFWFVLQTLQHQQTGTLL